MDTENFAKNNKYVLLLITNMELLNKRILNWHYNIYCFPYKIKGIRPILVVIIVYKSRKFRAAEENYLAVNVFIYVFGPDTEHT